jgi:hypothetical protein
MLMSRKGLARLAAFVCLFAALTYPWAALGHAFESAFSSVANVGLGAFLAVQNVQARFTAADPRVAEEQSNVVLSVKNTTSEQVSRVPLGVRRIAYVPFATFIALIAVTPVTRRRKLVVVAAGLGLLLVRVVVAVSLPLARHFGAIEKDSLGNLLSRVVYYSLIEPPNLMYAAPIVVWALLLLVTAPRGSAWLSSKGPARAQI